MNFGALKIAPDNGVRRLQTALYALGQKHRDRVLLAVQADGVVGPVTVKATQRALGTYVVQGSGIIPQNWLRGTSSTIIRASANDIARYIEDAAGSTPYIPGAPAPPPSAIPPQQARMLPSSGGDTTMNPQYYPPQQAYYPPQQPAYPGYYPQAPRAPGGLPANQASLDIKAFIPAQYDHIQLHPAGAIAILVVGALTVMLVMQHKKSKA